MTRHEFRHYMRHLARLMQREPCHPRLGRLIERWMFR